ncbi:thioredoxin [bacterium]|nr:thioredoxin [bacterium]
MLNTNLKHLETDADTQKALSENENVMICCGRMGPMCIPVYIEMERLEKDYPHVAFRDLEFDSAAADFIKNLPECTGFMGLPFTVYFKNGQAVAATTSTQSREEIVENLDREFGKPG